MNRTHSKISVALAASLLVPAFATAETVVASYASADSVAVTAPSYTASGRTLQLDLQVGVPTGTDLTVIRNTGLDFIEGTFDNLPHGQEITLSHEGVRYRFVANYHGGTGNDLVLQWANARLLAWGDNYQGKLGNNSALPSPFPVPVDMSGILAGKTVVSLASGSHHNLALCSDGTLAAWGDNGFDQLGVDRVSHSKTPAEVDRTGVLAGKRVVVISAGGQQSLALCADGTLVAWGDNLAGTLGNNTIGGSSLPVAVDQSRVLAGKTVVDVALGYEHALILCSDGTMAAWGSNGQGQLGTGSGEYSLVPVPVDQSGALAGKTVIAISTRGLHNLALCSDGTLVAWGFNLYGQLGNNSTAKRLVPTRVNQNGVLFRKEITAISAGTSRSLVLAGDGMLAAWGAGIGGQLGNNDTTDSLVPVPVDRNGDLRGKWLTGIASGDYHSLAFASDGSMLTWGGNEKGQLGYETTSWFSAAPRKVVTTGLRPGEHFSPRTRSAGQDHTVVVVASPPAPTEVTTSPPTDVTGTSVTFNGGVNPNGSETEVFFEYGTTTDYGATIGATPSPIAGTDLRLVSATLTGLAGDTSYHFRVVASSPGGVRTGEDTGFATSAPVTLDGLEFSAGPLEPAFTPSITRYTLTVANATAQVSVTPTPAEQGATVTVNGNEVAPGTASPPLDLVEGPNLVTVLVTGADGLATGSYTVSVTRLPGTFLFDSVDDTGATVGRLTASGSQPAFALNFALSPGTRLVVIDNTGLQAIDGTFDNLAQGQLVHLDHAGVSYPFVANYFGGNGNDLVLQWGNVRLVDWGGGTVFTSPVPTPLGNAGVLDGKRIIQAAAGRFFSVVLSSDGTVATWGDNLNGQLGNNGTGPSDVPVAVDQSGALAGRQVVAVAAGAEHALALCADGTVAAWGSNDRGQLGSTGIIRSLVPVMVETAGALAGRRVIAIAAGARHSLALCSDGTVASWGGSALGHPGQENSRVPVLVDQSGVLAGRTVVAIAAGGYHALALCADGTLAAWGANNSGQLGMGNTVNAKTPVLVDRSGIFSGRTISSIAAGTAHSLALCGDGTVAAWGANPDGRLGNGNTVSSAIPVAVDQGGVLAGRTVAAISAGMTYSLALCSDGILASWGENSSRQLGNNSALDSSVPVLVDTGALSPGELFAWAGSSPESLHSIALVASPPAPQAATLAATAPTNSSATLNGSVHPNGSVATAFFEYGRTDAYGMTAPASPASLDGNAPVAVSSAVDGLVAGAVYHYRVVASGVGGTVSGGDRTFLANAEPAFTIDFPSEIEATPSADDLMLDLAPFVNDPDPGDTITWSIVSVSDPGLFRTLGIDPTSGRLGATYNPWVSGSSEVVFQVTDSFGSIARNTTTFLLPPHPTPQFRLSGDLVLNRQTGLYEHTLVVTNPAAREIAGFDLTIGGLTDDVRVNNASNRTGDSATIHHHHPFAAGASVSLVVEYYAPVRGMLPAPQITVLLVTEPDTDPPAPGGAVQVDRCMVRADGSTLIEFTASPGALYEVHYSDDGLAWKLSPTRVRAAGNRVQWIDRGPPRTDTPPAGAPCRFYRVRFLTEHSD